MEYGNLELGVVPIRRMFRDLGRKTANKAGREKILVWVEERLLERVFVLGFIYQRCFLALWLCFLVVSGREQGNRLHAHFDYNGENLFQLGSLSI